MGYHAHGMSGIQYDIAQAELGLSDRYVLNAACVIGRIGDLAQLDERLQAREHPSDRKPQSDVRPCGQLPLRACAAPQKGEHSAPGFRGLARHDG